MRLSFILIVFLFFFTKSFCCASVIQLDDCISLALQNNLDIKQEELTLKISSYQERAARALFYPTFSLMGNSAYLRDVQLNNQFMGLVLKQPVYSGGKLTNNLNASKENKNSKIFSLHESELLLENRVFREYMNSLRYWKFMKAYKDAIMRAEEHLKSVNNDVMKGKRCQEDIMRWQVLIDSYKESLVRSTKNLENSKIKVNTLMNQDASEQFDVLDSNNLRFEYADFMIRQKIFPENKMMEMFIDYALVFSPAYKKKLTEIKVADYNYLSEKSTVAPTVDLISNYSGRSLPLMGVYSVWDAGMYMNFDLYKQQKYENIQISKLQLELSRVKGQQFLLNLKSDVRTQYNSNASSNEQVSLQRKQQKISRQYLKGITSRYKAGLASNLDVIEAFDSFYKNQIALVDSIYNAFTEFANLYNLIGFSFVYRKPAPNMYWRYKENGLQLDYDLKALFDDTFDFMNDKDFEKIKTVFRNNPSLFKARDKSGQTALHYAIDRGYVNCVEFVLQNGADPDAANYLDGTPIVRAMIFCPEKESLKVIELLLIYGVDVNKVSHYFSPLNWAAMKNKMEIVKLLIGAGASVNVQDAYMRLTPLHFSAFWGNVEMARFLIDKGADMAIENADGLTAYDLAWQFEQEELIRFFESLERDGNPRGLE